MALIKNPLSGGGGGGGSISVVNGIIEQYKAVSGAIDANTFVELVATPSEIMLGQETTFTGTTSTSWAGQTQAIVALASNKFVVNNASSEIAVVAIADDGAVTIGTPVSVSDTVYWLETVDEDTAIVFTYRSNYLYAAIVTVSGTTITVGTRVQISTTKYSGYDHTVTAQYMGGNKFWLGFGIGQGMQTLSHALCSYSGSTITVVSVSQISSSSYHGTCLCSVKYDDNTVLFFHRGTSTNYRGHTITINGTALSYGTAISSITGAESFYQYATDAVKLAGDYILLKGSGALILLSYDGSTASVVSSYTTTDVYDSSWLGRLGYLSDDYILYGGSSLYWVSVNSGAISINTNYISANGLRDIAVDSGGRILALNSSSVQEIIKAPSVSVAEATSSTGIFGLTSQSITSTTAGNVWVLDTGESE